VQRSTKMYQILQRSIKIYKDLQRCTTMYKGLQRSTKIYKNVQRSTKTYNSTKIYKDLKRCTKIHKDLQRCIRHDWRAPCFLGSDVDVPCLIPWHRNSHVHVCEKVWARKRDDGGVRTPSGFGWNWCVDCFATADWCLVWACLTFQLQVL